MSENLTAGGEPPQQGTPPGTPGRRWGVIAVIVAVVLSLGGVGVAVAVVDHRADVRAEAKAEVVRQAAEKESLAAEKAEEDRLADEKAEEERLAQEAAELAERQAIQDSCLDQLSPLLDALDIVDARLNVGLSQSDLSALVGDASVAYNRIDVDELGTGVCLSAGAKLESAMNAYSKSTSQWSDCIYDYGCDVESIDPNLQAHWSAASRNFAKAESLLDKLDPAKSGGSNVHQT